MFADSIDSTLAFQIENSLGSSLLTADTADMAVDVGGSALFADPTDSTTALVVNNADGSTTVLSVDTTDDIVDVASLVDSGGLTVDGHIITGGSTPGIEADAAADCGGTPTAVISGDDTAGTITITTSANTCSSSGDLATVTFTSTYGAVPHVTLTPESASSGALIPYVDGISAARFPPAALRSPPGTHPFPQPPTAGATGSCSRPHRLAAPVSAPWSFS